MPIRPIERIRPFFNYTRAFWARTAQRIKLTLQRTRKVPKNREFDQTKDRPDHPKMGRRIDKDA